jgi:hypothetical protein
MLRELSKTASLILPHSYCILMRLIAFGGGCDHQGKVNACRFHEKTGGPGASSQRVIPAILVIGHGFAQLRFAVW